MIPLPCPVRRTIVLPQCMDAVSTRWAKRRTVNAAPAGCSMPVGLSRLPRT